MKRTVSPLPVPDQGSSAQRTASDTVRTPPQATTSASTQSGGDKVTNSPSPKQAVVLPSSTVSPANATLTSKITILESQIQALESELTRTYAELTPYLNTFSSTQISPDRPATALSAAAAAGAPITANATTAARSIVQRHIKLLNEYNEIKEAGLELMGLIAEARGVRLGSVMEEFGVKGRD